MSVPSDIPAAAPLPDTSDLLRTKLLPPRPRSALVVRQQLLDRLSAGLSRKLTVLSAPAGFGKTTLVGQWLSKLKIENEELKNVPGAPHSQFSILNSQFKIAWVSLDAGDNDPVRFWRYLISACQTLQDGIGQAALARLSLPPAQPFMPPPLEPVLTAFLNDLAGLAHDSVLVLEDYHAITAPQIHAMLAFMLDQLPARLHLIVVSRGDPPLPLARLRARGQLCELQADDLRFSLDETAAFVGQALPFPLAPTAISLLYQRTEGWPAGLRLALLALPEQAGAQEIEQALDAFTGSRPAMEEYLAADVLDGQPQPVQTFLLQTSILSRLSASLCDSVTGRDDSAELLAQIERANLFLLPLDETQGWYRYHTLFAEAMRHLARRRFGDHALRACYSRAGAWYEQHGMLPDAIDAALAAQTWERAARLIERIVDSHSIIDPYAPHTLRRWLDQLPEAVLHQHPLLCFGATIVLVRTSEQPRAALMPQVERLAQLAEHGWRAENNLARLGQLYAARALFGLWQGRIEQAISCARQALAWLPAADVTWRGVCLGFAGKGQLQEGRLDLARQTLLEGRALNELIGSRPAIRATTIMLGDICAAQLECQQAAALYQQALADALDDGDPSDQGQARLGLAQLAYAQNDLDSAQQEALAALAFAGQIKDEALLVQSELLLARLRRAHGSTSDAQQRLATLLAQLSPLRQPRLYRQVLAEQARLQLACGDLAAVQRWATTRTRYGGTLPGLLHEQEELLIARLLIARGALDDARRRLEQWRPAAQVDGRLCSLLEIQVLLAIACAAGQQIETGVQFLREALGRAQSAGFDRLFLDEGAALGPLLRALIPTLREHPLRSFAQRLLQAIVLEQTEPALPAPLSPQEQRVLGLLANGYSNPEIAQQLVVSVNTVKTQLKQIYRKLGATSRQEACDLARALRLLA